MRKCDFGGHSFSVFLHLLGPMVLAHFKGRLAPLWDIAYRHCERRVQSGGMESTLIAVVHLCDAQAANLVLQRRTLQSETLGGSPLAGDASRCGFQSIDDYRGFRLSKRRGRSSSNNDLG